MVIRIPYFVGAAHNGPQEPLDDTPRLRLPPSPSVAQWLPTEKLPDDPALACSVDLMSMGGSSSVRWIRSWSGHMFYFESGVLKGALLSTQPVRRLLRRERATTWTEPALSTAIDLSLNKPNVSGSLPPWEKLDETTWWVEMNALCQAAPAMSPSLDGASSPEDGA
jgi:hypothetical protein